MAKPIRATPALTGVDALNFVKKMHRREKANRLSHADKLLIKIMNANEKLFNV